jgi:glutathione peroxidase
MTLPRRTFLTAAAACVAGTAHAETFASDFRFEAIEGGTLDLAAYQGRVLLVVNTASFCGYTYQYKGLEALHAALTPQGLTVIGVPSQVFDQEKNSNGEVKAFCDATFGVRFPMAGLTHVTGSQAHPFYRWVSDTRGWQPRWNFYKVLVGRDGRIAGLYTSDDEPQGPKLSADIARALGGPLG